MNISRILTSRGLVAVTAAAVTVVALSAPAGADSGTALGARGVEGVALRVARAWGDRHPRAIEYASGTLEDAMAVLEPEGGSTSPSSPGDVESHSAVDLIAVWGHFTSNGSRPRGTKAPTGTVMELIVDAHSGFVEVRSLSHRLPAPLSRLGSVRVLHGAGGGP
ncbi:MAG: hypothetical protein JWM60_2214, partial [Solirubrobacterales bacterium]|nr:hypothetical protein [Solirubrobacterales bacterium]